jgi:hypothetical protein
MISDVNRDFEMGGGEMKMTNIEKKLKIRNSNIEIRNNIKIQII